MSGYRSRAGKPTAALWLMVVLADAAWAVTSGIVALFGTLVIALMAALTVLVARNTPPQRKPLPVRVRARTDHRSWRM